MLVALSLLLLAQAETPAISPHTHHIRENRRLGGRWGGAGLAFFEFAPASGAGMPAVCSSTAPTGAKGEALTFTRATTATCQATGSGGMVSTGIANGDLSTVASGVARVEYNRNGVKGVRTESAVTETALRTAEFPNAAWVLYKDGATAFPVMDGGVMTAPDGTASASQLLFGATTGSQSSIIYQSGALSAAAEAGTVYLRSSSGSGTIDICLGTTSCGSCTWVSTSWTRCVRNATASGTLSYFYGNATFYNGGTARSDASVFLWGANVHLGSVTTSYIPATSATATRNADVVSLPVTLSGTTFSAAISYDAPAVLVSGATAFQIYVDANNSVTAALDGSSHVTCTFRIGGSNSTVTSSATLSANAVNRVACTYGASGRSACVGGACTTTAGALTMPTGAATFYVGTRSATGNESNGVMSQGCYDPSDARCI